MIRSPLPDGASVSHFTMGCGPVCPDPDSDAAGCASGCDTDETLGGEGVGMRSCHCASDLCNGSDVKSVSFVYFLFVVVVAFVLAV